MPLQGEYVGLFNKIVHLVIQYANLQHIMDLMDKWQPQIYKMLLMKEHVSRHTFLENSRIIVCIYINLTFVLCIEMFSFYQTVNLRSYYFLYQTTLELLQFLCLKSESLFFEVVNNSI